MLPDGSRANNLHDLQQHMFPGLDVCYTDQIDQIAPWPFRHENMSFPPALRAPSFLCASCPCPCFCVVPRTKDAFRPGEFTATIRTEQYRDLLRAEKAIMEKHRDPEKEHAAAEVRTAVSILPVPYKRGYIPYIIYPHYRVTLQAEI